MENKLKSDKISNDAQLLLALQERSCLSFAFLPLVGSMSDLLCGGTSQARMSLELCYPLAHQVCLLNQLLKWSDGKYECFCSGEGEKERRERRSFCRGFASSSKKQGTDGTCSFT